MQTAKVWYHMLMLPILVFFAVVFLTYSRLMFDSDLGWTLRIGAHTLQFGLAKTDPFSYTMPSYPFVDHEWLTHIIQYWLFSHGGAIAMGSVFALIMIAAITISTRTKYTSWHIIHAMLLGSALLSQFIPKPSVLSLLYVAILMTVLRSKNRRLSYALPPLFLVWANTHGGFLYGLGVYGLYEICAMISARQFSRRSALLFVLCAGATLLNPYGWGMWTSVLESVRDPRLRLTVSEWMPAFMSIQVSLFFLLGLYVMLFVRMYKKLKLQERALFIVTLAMGITSSRNLPLWLVIAAPLATVSIEQIIAPLTKDVAAIERIKKALIGLFCIASCILLYQVFFTTRTIILRNENVFYPRAAIAYLDKNPCKARVFTSYEWGGYYVWKNPNAKVFIDGRMPSWRQTARAGESTDALADMYDMYAARRPVSYYAKRYNIACFMLPTRLISPPAKSTPAQLKQTALFRQDLLQHSHVVYQDSVATVLRYEKHSR